MKLCKDFSIRVHIGVSFLNNGEYPRIWLKEICYNTRPLFPDPRNDNKHVILEQ